MTREEFLAATKGRLIVSCQALPQEPLHGASYMARMAVAVAQGGAAAIRANSVADITAIKQCVALPIIGIIKREYPGSGVYITPTLAEVDALAGCGAEVIATDCTRRKRPQHPGPEAFFAAARARHPQQVFMADCSTLEEARLAEKLGFDIVSTTLRGYTEYTKGATLPDFGLIEEIRQAVTIPLIVEGGIWDAETFARVHAIPGVHAVVIGSAITRPLEITRHFLRAIE